MSYDNFMTCLTTCLTTMFVNRAPGIHLAHGYLPSHKASLYSGWYQIILLGDRGTCVNNLPRVVTDGQESNQRPVTPCYSYTE